MPFGGPSGNLQWRERTDERSRNPYDAPAAWFTHEHARWRPTHTSGVEDVTRWAIDDEGRIWLTTVSTHSCAQHDADPSVRRVYPALLLESAVRTVRDVLGSDPFPWDLSDVLSESIPPQDYLPILGRGRMVINGRLHLGTTIQVDSCLFVATVVDGVWVGALQPRGRQHPKLTFGLPLPDTLTRTG